jgi:hypothetical protein
MFKGLFGGSYDDDNDDEEEEQGDTRPVDANTLSNRCESLSTNSPPSRSRDAYNASNSDLEEHSLGASTHSASATHLLTQQAPAQLFNQAKRDEHLPPTPK